jgi:hypothetical protein
MVFMLHWTACGYWMVVDNQPADQYGRTEQHEEEWLPPQFILTADFSNQYAFAFFWSVSVVTGAGWDIIPATSTEVAFSSIMILTGTVLYITILGSVTSIVSNLNQAKSRKMAQLDAVLSHLHATKASRALVHKIRGYYDFVWSDDQNASLKSPASFNDEVETLPRSLQVCTPFPAASLVSPACPTACPTAAWSPHHTNSLFGSTSVSMFSPSSAIHRSPFSRRCTAPFLTGFPSSSRSQPALCLHSHGCGGGVSSCLKTKWWAKVTLSRPSILL